MSKKKTKPTHRFADLPDARLSFPAPNVVRLHSAAGTAQSRAYRVALARLLADLGRSVTRIEITSAKALAAAPQPTRRKLWGITDADLPHHDAWRRQVMKAAAAWGRPAGAKGGGNGHKQVDLLLSADVDPAELGAVPRG